MTPKIPLSRCRKCPLFHGHCPLNDLDPCILAPDEDAPLVEGPGIGAAGDYTYKKRLLEAELRAECADRSLSPVILRPAFLYGPYNYAPRESWYIEKVVKGEPLPVPFDGAGQFQTVYVKDAAE